MYAQILLKKGAKPTRDAKYWLDPIKKEVVKNEMVKLLDIGIIYPISDSEWISLVQCLPKKGGLTMVVNESSELIPIRIVTSWRVCIDFYKV